MFMFLNCSTQGVAPGTTHTACLSLYLDRMNSFNVTKFMRGYFRCCFFRTEADPQLQKMKKHCVRKIAERTNR